MGLGRPLRRKVPHLPIYRLNWLFFRRLFAKSGYSIALIARGAEIVDRLATEINTQGGHVNHLSIIY